MRRKLIVGTTSASALAATIAAVAAVAGSAPPPARAARAASLTAFDSCGALLAHVKRAALRTVGPYGLPGAVAYGVPAPAEAGAADAAPPAPEPSGTNVQEPGVDEPDTVKTDGTTIFALAQGEIQAVDATGPEPRLVGSLPLDDGWGQQLLLRGDRLLVLATSGGWVEPLPVEEIATDVLPMPGSPQTTLTEVDVSDPSAMRVVRTVTVEASLVAARLTGPTARVVVTSQPADLDFADPQTNAAADLAAAEQANRDEIGRSTLATWLPRYTVRDASGRESTSRRLVACRDVSRPHAFSGLGVLSVLTIDLDRSVEPLDTDAVLGGGETVYASQSRLYVATQRWVDPAASLPDAPPPPVTTAIHEFDVSSPGATEYRASGQVGGYLLGQWSLSEQNGYLRVVSTDAPLWWGNGESQAGSAVTVLAEKEGRLVTVGRVEGLGRGERVYAVRFLGDLGYVVTFRQVDPLHVVDLSDPERPRVRGELHIPGFSAYLHPIGENLLLGVGQDATNEGRVLGTQVSVFDVSDPASPTRLAHHRLGEGWSEAEADHHAFLYDPPTRIVVLPFASWGLDDTGFERWWSGAAVLRAGLAGVEELRAITHPAPAGADPAFENWPEPIRRSLVLGGSLYTVSETGVLATSLSTLADSGWAPFALNG